MCGEPNSDVEDAVIDALIATDSFLMDGKTQTYGEMPRADKEADNHRARAFEQLLELLPARR